MKKIFALVTLVASVFMTTVALASESIENTIANGVNNFQTTIDVSDCNATPEEVVKTFEDMFNTVPVMANLDGSIRCDYKGKNAESITVGYINTSAEIAKAKEVMNSIVAKASTMDNSVDKAKFVHDYLINNSEYDHTYNSTTMYDLLVNGKGTCNSYALSFKDAMDKLGIECTVVVENDMSHSWDQIKVDDKWYNVDVTWDENYSVDGIVNSTFFMKSDSYFMAKEHRPWTSVNVCY